MDSLNFVFTADVLALGNEEAPGVGEGKSPVLVSYTQEEICCKMSRRVLVPNE